MQKNISSNRKYLNFFSSSLFFSFEKWQCGASHSRPNSASGLQGRTGRTGPATAQLANPSDRGRASARSPLDPSLLDPHATHARAHPPPPWHTPSSLDLAPPLPLPPASRFFPADQALPFSPLRPFSSVPPPPGNGAHGHHPPTGPSLPSMASLSFAPLLSSVRPPPATGALVTPHQVS